MSTTTAEAIRDRIITVISALTPTSQAGTGFRAYRNEGDANFETWCEANPAQAFRRFQVRDTGSDGSPDVSNTDVEQRTVAYTLTVAYPQNNRTGKGAALDRDDVMRTDRLQIEKAIGMLGQANFAAPYPSATWRFEDWDVIRTSGAGVDFVAVSVGYQYYLAR